MFDDMNSKIRFIYGKTKILRSLLRLSLSMLVVAVSVLYTNSFFNLEFILLKIKSRG